jgi:hypothetical protein
VLFPSGRCGIFGQPGRNHGVGEYRDRGSIAHKDTYVKYGRSWRTALVALLSRQGPIPNLLPSIHNSYRWPVPGVIDGTLNNADPLSPDYYGAFLLASGRQNTAILRVPRGLEAHRTFSPAKEAHPRASRTCRARVGGLHVGLRGARGHAEHFGPRAPLRRWEWGRNALECGSRHDDAGASRAKTFEGQACREEPGGQIILSMRGSRLPAHVKRQVSPCRMFWTMCGRKAARHCPPSCLIEG